MVKMHATSTNLFRNAYKIVSGVLFNANITHYINFGKKTNWEFYNDD